MRLAQILGHESLEHDTLIDPPDSGQPRRGRGERQLLSGDRACRRGTAAGEGRQPWADDMPVIRVGPLVDVGVPSDEGDGRRERQQRVRAVVKLLPAPALGEMFCENPVFPQHATVRREPLPAGFVIECGDAQDGENGVPAQVNEHVPRQSDATSPAACRHGARPRSGCRQSRGRRRSRSLHSGSTRPG